MADTKIDFEVKATIGDAQKAFDLIEQKIAAVGETVEGLTKKSGDLKIALGQSKIGSEAFSFLSKAVAKTETDLMNAAIAAKKYANEVQNMSEINRRGAMVGLSFNRIIQDAGYFGQSMAMGFMAVGNNITYFAEQLSFAKRENLSMTAVLKGTLTGVNAWMFAINLAVSAITFFTVQNRGAAKSLQEWDLKTLIGSLDNYAEGLRKVTKALTELSDLDLSSTIDKLNKKLMEADLNRLKSIRGMGAGRGGLISLLFGMNVKELDEEIKRLSGALGVATDEFVKRISNPDSWNFLKKQMDDLNDKVKEGDLSLLGALEKARTKFKEIDELINPKDKKKGKGVSSWDFALDELDAKMEDFKERIANQKEYFDTVLFADPKAMSYFTDLIKKQADEMTAIGLNGEAFMLEEKKKLWEKFIKWRQENDPMFRKLLKVDAGDKPKMLKTDIEENLYRKTLSEFSKLGSNLRQIFGDAGGTFLNSMIEALNVVTAIAEVIQSIKLIMTALDLISTVSTGGVIVAPAKIANWVLGGGGSSGSIQSGGNGMSQSPSQMIIPIYIGEKKIETIIIDTTKQAQRLRYL